MDPAERRYLEDEDSSLMKTFKGAITGLVAGTIWGTIVATWYDVPHVERSVALPGLLRTFRMMGGYGATFAAIGGVYIGVKQLVENYRGKRDLVNGVVGGFVVGASILGYRDNASATEEIRQKDNTVRVDPLENFRKYRGGFNITNKNYWSVNFFTLVFSLSLNINDVVNMFLMFCKSLIFTGVYGYAIGMLFLLCGILYGGFLVITGFCYHENGGDGKRMKVFPCNYKTCDVSLVLVALFLMLIAIVATGLVLVGSARFHSEAKTSVDIIIETANKASETIHNTTEALKGMENSLVEANVNIEASSNLSSSHD